MDSILLSALPVCGGIGRFHPVARRHSHFGLYRGSPPDRYLGPRTWDQRPLTSGFGVGAQDDAAPQDGVVVVLSWVWSPGQESTGRTLDRSPMRIAVTSAWARLVAPSFW